MELNEFINNGKQVLPFAFSRSEYANLIVGLKRIIDLPEQEREDWLFSVAGDTTSEPDSGLSERKAEDGRDPKFFYHHRPSLRSQLLSAGIDTKPHQEFLDLSDQLYNLLAIKSEEVLASLDQQLPGYNFAERLALRPMDLRHVLRFLYYKSGYEEMSELHDDRGNLSFAVSESRAGLFFEHEEHCHVSRDNEILLFSGLKMELLTQGKLKSKRHYVKNLVINEPRWAIVFFTHIDFDVPDTIVEQIAKGRRGIAVPA